MKYVLPAVMAAVMLCNPGTGQDQPDRGSGKMKKNNQQYLHESRKFYYDFTQEKKITGWKLREKNGDFYTFETILKCADPIDAVVLFDGQRTYERNRILSLSLRTEDCSFAPETSEIAYVSLYYGIRYAFRCKLKKGPQKLFVTVQCSQPVSAERIVCTWIPDLPVPETRTVQRDSFHRIPAVVYKNTAARPIPADYVPGTGRKQTPGHFGFTKGDGILDCAMSTLGIVDKLFICGQPRYRKPYKWTVSLLPAGLRGSEMYHGSYPPALTGIEKDQIEVNHLSVKWSSDLACADGSSTRFSCRYSMASPFIMVESDRPAMRLSLLEYAGNYHYLMFAGKDGICVRSLREGQFSGPEMTENWILLFGTDEFPDVPILLVFTKPVTDYRAVYRRGRLSELLFNGPDKMFYATPFGIECLYPVSPDDAVFLRDAVRRSRFWSRAALAWPVRCKEFFKNDHEQEKVRIIQQFEYLYTRDHWNTKPLKLAPYPAVSSLAGTVDFMEEPEDFRFPTKFGYLQGVIGSDVSSYEIPFMPRGRRYPLPEGDSIRKHLKNGLEDYFQFQEHFPPETAGYIYSGSILEPYAWTASMFLFMEPADRDRLRRHLAERIGPACDPDFQTRYPLISWSQMMKECPDRKKLIKMISSPEQVFLRRYNTYSRKEPFTGERIAYTYINAVYYSHGWFPTGAREEIEKFPFNMIENDWGVGMSLYYLYLSCLAAGDFTPVKQHWKDLKTIWSFYDQLCDWALMGSAYSDNGLSWVEGGNYGGFTAYVNLAEAAGKRADMEYGIYLAAKQLTLRLALLKAGQHYFYKFFGVEPYGLIWGFFEEKWSGHLFQFVPNLTPLRYQTGSLGTITTEGMYPETFETLVRLAPEEMRKLRRNSYQVLRDPRLDLHEYSINQASACLLQCALLDDDYPAELAAAELKEGEKRHEIIEQWRGIHVFSRNLPKHYFSAQLRAYLLGRSQPMHLEHWSGLRIDRAEYLRKRKTACIELKVNENQSGFLRIRVKQEPRSVTMNGRKLTFRTTNKNKIELSLKESGILKIEFD